VSSKPKLKKTCSDLNSTPGFHCKCDAKYTILSAKSEQRPPRACGGPNSSASARLNEIFALIPPAHENSAEGTPIQRRPSAVSAMEPQKGAAAASAPESSCPRRRASDRIKTAKLRSAIAVQGRRGGLARPTPVTIPCSQKVDTAVAGSLTENEGGCLTRDPHRQSNVKVDRRSDAAGRSCPAPNGLESPDTK
jgi:hypothetical protein